MDCPLRRPDCEKRNCAWPILEKEKCGMRGLLLLFAKALGEDKKDRKRIEEKTKNEKEWLRTGEAARFLGVHPNTIREWEAKGILKAYRLGSRRDRRFSRAELQKVMGILKTQT